MLPEFLKGIFFGLIEAFRVASSFCQQFQKNYWENFLDWKRVPLYPQHVFAVFSVAGRLSKIVFLRVTA